MHNCNCYEYDTFAQDPEEDKAMPSSRRGIMNAGASSNAGPAAAGDNGYAVVAVEDTTTTRSAGINYHPQVEQTGDTGGPPAVEKAEDDWLQRFLLVISPKYFPTYHLQKRPHPIVKLGI